MLYRIGGSRNAIANEATLSVHASGLTNAGSSRSASGPSSSSVSRVEGVAAAGAGAGAGAGDDGDTIGEGDHERASMPARSWCLRIFPDGLRGMSLMTRSWGIL